MKFDSLDSFCKWLLDNSPCLDDVLGFEVVGMGSTELEDFIVCEGEWIRFENDKIVDGWLYW